METEARVRPVVESINCCQCGGTMLFTEGQHLIKCDYCGTKNLLIEETGISQYCIDAKLSPDQAIHSAESTAFNTFGIPQDFSATVNFDSAELFFIPIFEVTGLRVGRFITKKIESTDRHKASTIYAGGMNINDDMISYQRFIQEKYLGSVKKRKVHYDSRIVFNDLMLSDLAVNIPDWGLIHIPFQKHRREKALELLPLDIRKLQLKGTVIHPSRSTDQFVSNSLKTYGTQGISQAEMVDTCIKLVYYPVFRVIYTYRNTPYRIVVDGISGDTLYARIPQGNGLRVLGFLFGTGLLGFSMGTLATLLKGTSISFSYLFHISFFLAYIITGLSFLISGILSFAWVRLRYPAEIIKDGKFVNKIYVGKKSAGYFEKMFANSLKSMDQAFTHEKY